MLSRFRRGSQKVDADSSERSKTSQNNKKTGKPSADENSSEERSKFVNVRYRQWLYDRIDGIPRPLEGRHDHLDPYPPSFLCLPFSIIKCCPYLLEENYVCTLLGRMGCCRAPWARNAVMQYSLLLNVFCLLTGVYACLAIADSNYDLLQIAPMAEIGLVPVPESFFAYALEIKVGLAAMTMNNPNTGVQEVIRFDQFCDLINVQNGLENYFQSPEDETCRNCESVRIQMVIGLLVAVSCLIPSIFSQCTRLFDTTDVNCSKCWALFLELLSLAGFVLAWYQFTYGCLKTTFYEGEVGYTRSGQVTEIDSLNEVVRVDFDWGAGYAIICLYSAFGLKVISFLCDCCLPTPIITRNTYEQKVYEVKVLGQVRITETGMGDRDESFSEGDDENGDEDVYYHEESSSSYSYESEIVPRRPLDP